MFKPFTDALRVNDRTPLGMLLAKLFQVTFSFSFTKSVTKFPWKISLFFIFYCSSFQVFLVFLNSSWPSWQFSLSFSLLHTVHLYTSLGVGFQQCYFPQSMHVLLLRTSLSKQTPFPALSPAYGLQLHHLWISSWHNFQHVLLCRGLMDI